MIRAFTNPADARSAWRSLGDNSALLRFLPGGEVLLFQPASLAIGHPTAARKSGEAA